MDHTQDVKNHVSSVDEAAVAALAHRYRLVLSQPDSELVAFSDSDELERVKKNFLIDKLGLSESDDLDGAIAAVGQKLAGVNRKSRLTVYYLLADHFGKLDAVKALDD